ncbi:MAG: hemerythrin domain-containing protein [Phycisphaerae bacterium]
MNASTDSQRPSGVLRDEHQTILRVIAVLKRLMTQFEKGEGFAREPLGRCVEFFRLFADACHHAKEEDLLFPALESRGIPREGGPIGVMLYEHTVARGLTKDMGEALTACQAGDADGENRFHRAATDYIELLTNHIQKEDDVLFVMGDRFLTDQDQDALCDSFCQVGCRSFGGKKKEELQRIADELEAQCPP